MKYIVSLTSHGNRIKHLNDALGQIIIDKSDDYKIVLTIFKGEEYLVTDYIKRKVREGLLELIIAPQDLGPHLKYFYVMKKYRNVPIITVDDDCITTKSRLNSLYNAYLLNSNCINAMRVHRMKLDHWKLTPYTSWEFECKSIEEPNKWLFATGVGGVIYPPDIFKVNDKMIPEILKCKYADDIYLKVLEIRQGLNVKWVKCTTPHPFVIRNEEVKAMALMAKNNTGRNDKYIAAFQSDFHKLLRAKNG